MTADPLCSSSAKYDVGELLRFRSILLDILAPPR